MLAKNGNIYCIPFGACKVLCIDPRMQTATPIGDDLSGVDDDNKTNDGDNYKYAGGCLALDGKIYCPPFGASRVLCIDPVAQTATTIGDDLSREGKTKWMGAALGHDGNVYCPPFGSSSVMNVCASHVLCIMPSKQSAVTVGEDLSGHGGCLWYGATCGRDGLIYCSPGNAARVLRISPADQTAVCIGPDLSEFGSYKWVGASLVDKDGSIFCAPGGASHVLRIDPASQSAEVIGPPLAGASSIWCHHGTSFARRFLSAFLIVVSNRLACSTGFGHKYYGSSLGPDGCVYCMPRDASHVLRIDPVLKTVKAIGDDLRHYGSAKWYGAALAADGCIYGAPGDTSHVLRIDITPAISRVNSLLETQPQALGIGLAANTESRELMVRGWARMISQTSHGAECVDKCIEASGAPALSAETFVTALNVLAPEVAVRLLNFGAAISEETLMENDAGVWKRFVLAGEATADAMSLVVAKVPALGQTALVAAIAARRPALVSRLVGAGVNVDETMLLKNDASASEWHKFVMEGESRFAALRSLITLAPGLGPSALTHAITECNPAVVTYLLRSCHSRVDESTLSMDGAEAWLAFVLGGGESCEDAVNDVIIAAPALGSIALNGAVAACDSNAVLRLLKGNGHQIVDVEALLASNAAGWRTFVLTKGCLAAAIVIAKGVPKLSAIAMTAAIASIEPATVLELLASGATIDGNALLMNDAADWRGFVVADSTKEAVSCVVAAAPALGRSALFAAFSAHSPAIIVKLLVDGSIVEQEAVLLRLLVDNAVLWRDFVVDDSCVDAVDRIVSVAAGLGPPAIVAAISSHRPMLVMRLLGGGVKLDEATLERLLTDEDGEWRDFITDDSCIEAVDYILENCNSPSLGSSVLKTAISALRPRVVERLLGSGVLLDSDSEEALLSSSSVVLRDFVVEASCTDALDQLISVTPSLGPCALAAAIVALVPAVVTRLLKRGVVLDDHAHESLLNHGAERWRAFVYAVRCDTTIEALVALAPKLGPDALACALELEVFGVASRLMRNLDVTFGEQQLKSMSSIRSDKTTLWHGIVTNVRAEKDDAFFETIETIAHQFPSLLDVTDGHKRTAYSAAIEGARLAMERAAYFGGRYKIDDTLPLHESATCAVLVAVDVTDNKRVVLKLMLNKEQFQRELAAREHLDERFVIPIINSSDDAALSDRWQTDVVRISRRMKLNYDNYQYGLVMQNAKRNLMVALLQERMSEEKIRQMLKEIIEALGHMHAQDQIHGDFKPLNAVRTDDGVWKLIDFDASVKRGMPTGSKTSMAWNPPEMTTKVKEKVLERKNLGITPDADPSYDFWAVGCLLFRAWSGRTLFRADDSDNLRDYRELCRLYNWDIHEAATAAKEMNLEMELNSVSPRVRIAACDLLHWLLERDPSKRPTTSADILNHAFFSQPGDHTGLRMSALHSASFTGDVDTVVSLIKNGGDINSQDHYFRRTPLQLAVEGLQSDVVEQLVLQASFLPAPTHDGELQAEQMFMRRSGSTIKKPQVMPHPINFDLTDIAGQSAMHSLLVRADELIDETHIPRWKAMFGLLFKHCDMMQRDRFGRSAMESIAASSNERLGNFFEQVNRKQRVDLFKNTVAVVPWSLGASSSVEAGEQSFGSWVKNLVRDENPKLPDLGDGPLEALHVLVECFSDIDGACAVGVCVCAVRVCVPFRARACVRVYSLDVSFDPRTRRRLFSRICT